MSYGFQTMNPPEFQESAWYQALTLIERLESLQAVRNQPSNVEINSALAERRFQRWRSQTPFTTNGYFEQRLMVDGTSEDEFRYLLGEPIEAVCNRCSPSPTWLTEILQVFSHPAHSNSLPLQEDLKSDKRAGFLNAVEPLLQQGREQVHKGVQALQTKYTGLPFDPDTVEDLVFANLPWQLIWMLERTMVLELNVARLQDRLYGDTPEERFEHFLARLKKRDVEVALFQEYPVLARQIKICVDHWVTFSLEFLDHLCIDWRTICTTFSPEQNPGLLTGVYANLGDRHREGRSVLIAEFNSGFYVVYKPKSLSVDVHFQALLTWLNQRGNHPSFRTLKVLNCGTYGWVEFVAVQGCSSQEEVQRFYQRQGGYLALLYCIEATDFHYENLIAAGEHPVLVDLESLFHPRPKQTDIEEIDQIAAIYAMDHSVLRVGLLPRRIWTDIEAEGIDISGLGGQEGQLSPDRLPYWEGEGTDEMRLNRQRMEMPGGQNRPTLNDAEVNALDYTDALITGFTTIYNLLLKHRDELLSDDGPLACFAEDEVRILIRPTMIYTRLLFESFHPDLLRNALERDRLFDRLWAPIKEEPYLAKVIPFEREDLQKNDIPMFTTRPSSHDLWSSSGDRIADFFAESGLELAQHRLQQLSERDLAQQLWFIRASLTSLSIDLTRKRQIYYPTGLETSVGREQLCSAAQTIGDRLEALALLSENNVTWLGLILTKERYWSPMPLGMDLYDGLPGIILFLAYLSAITQQPRYSKLAKAALATMRQQMERRKSSITWIGAFNGWGGLIYTLVHLAMLWNDSALLSEAEAIATRLPSLIEKDKQIDLANGAAGCIGSLISLYHCVPSEQTLAAAIQCGDFLIAHAQPMEKGIGWLGADHGETPLTGFSHGVAGIAWALLELSGLTGEDRFRTTALEAIAYERSVFSPEAGNWPDFRDLGIFRSVNNGDQNAFMAAWCHGAPGIGLARLRCLRYLNDNEIRAEIDTALKTTLAEGLGGDHSLCHGDLGNLELLVQAGEVLNEPQWSSKANQLASAILASIDQHGWLCGNPLGVESPGLMTGLAGIGYGFLRLADPERVPSVLVLEPPKQNNIKVGI